MITLQHVSKTFTTPDGPLRAVADASLQIDEGDIYGIIGFSGAGKSTLLRTINLLEKPDCDPQTSIVVDGREMTTLSKLGLNRARQSIGFVFQLFNLLNNRTVSENVAFPLEIAGQPKVAIDVRVREVSRNCWTFLTRPITYLSRQTERRPETTGCHCARHRQSPRKRCCFGGRARLPRWTRR